MMPKTDRRSSSAGTPSDDTESDGPDSLSRDEIFHILQTNRRRDAIDYLLDREGPVKMSDIAEHVAAKEHDTTVAQLSSTQRQRVYIPLYQSHLPKLDEKGIIEYDKSRGIVRPTDRLEVFRPFLEAASERPDRTADESDTVLGRAIGSPRAAIAGVGVGLLAATVTGLHSTAQLALAALVPLVLVLTTIATNFGLGPSTTDADDGRLPRRRNGA